MDASKESAMAPMVRVSPKFRFIILAASGLRDIMSGKAMDGVGACGCSAMYASRSLVRPASHASASASVMMLVTVGAA
ncbi:hypothetical protein GUJ93_ZPchr0013g34406 [Zizania palustris]|uniref:Uncharacterized protein n=1 Tax=Zizania palustris TaxID=103762 RepID=A0A8J6BYB9_ZIZPA|nr:hypothetical protein GUJ93_ZPchr0013g34406 [Zizania palustris]